MSDFAIKAGAEEPILRYTLTDADGPTDLAGATVHILIQPFGGGALLLSAATTPDADQTAHKGEGSYSWSGEEALPPGLYWVEFVVEQDSKLRRYPSDLETPYNVLAVLGNLGDLE